MISLYDHEAIARLTAHQKEKAWDLERSFDWNAPLKMDHPLLPLDEQALYFPGASPEERLAISQMMGLVVAISICEMEECLLRLRNECWEQIKQRFPVSPEFNELGEQFFVEEEKHTASFRRFFDKYSEKLNVDPKDLIAVLPIIEGTRTEKILRSNSKDFGRSFWWIVASVEQQFLHLFTLIRGQKERVEPLYFELHKKHFEEESRHAPFPFLVLELLNERNQSLKGRLHQKYDLIFSQLLQAAWTLTSLTRLKQLKNLKGKHPMFDVLARTYEGLSQQPKLRLLWRSFTSVPYISTLINLQSHKRVVRFADNQGVFHLDGPTPKQTRIVKY